ncbi:MAG: squalene--hopene cyclase [Verrucomicrobia bacterium]|nr:squalene--hopene cyclase [Verrucomicrobiota bacterium]
MIQDPWFGIDASKLESAQLKAREYLLDARHEKNHWIGSLSPSALSTATAIVAVHLAAEARLIEPEKADSILHRGLDWLASHANSDGGWGDTTLSLSNISTTTLCWAAFSSSKPHSEHHKPLLLKTERWISERTHGLAPDKIASTIIKRYGNDRTFSVPILTMCALAGKLGSGRTAWKHVIPLPFELAALPHSWFAALRLPVVSYALPALIAIGLVHHVRSPSFFPWIRMLRQKVIPRVLQRLERIQPPNGGFLEATPLTSFVTMSLIGAGYAEHAVVMKGLQFLINSQLSDGSWPIDTNLSTWVTTLAVNAIVPPREFQNSVQHLTDANQSNLREWLLNQQYRTVHPYTQAPPGGWAWTPLPGGVPDADDTPGALLALFRISPEDERTKEAALAGCQWLLGLQNSDGGIPTFCRGWGKLPFDKSSPDLTAHTIRAWIAWIPYSGDPFRQYLEKAVAKGLMFLAKNRKSDGTWSPLWFGNQWRADESNPIYGTAKVSCAIAHCLLDPRWANQAEKLLLNPHPAQTLTALQNADGSWGNARPSKGTIEETALAVEALSLLKLASKKSTVRILWKPQWNAALQAGARFLTECIHEGSWTEPAPIGFYFAKLWYFESLYPVVFSVAALNAPEISLAGSRPESAD